MQRDIKRKKTFRVLTVLLRLAPNPCGPPDSMCWGYRHEPPGLAHLISESDFTTAMCPGINIVYILSTVCCSRHPMCMGYFRADPLRLRVLPH